MAGGFGLRLFYVALSTFGQPLGDASLPQNGMRMYHQTPLLLLAKVYFLPWH